LTTWLRLPSKPPRYGASVFCLSGSFRTLFFGKRPKPSKRKTKERHGMENGNENAGGLKRTVQIKFRVTEAERDLIEEKMRLLGTNNLAAYLRKIAIDGYIIAADTTDLKTIAAECQKIGVNFNQIARRVNGSTRIYEQDFEEMQRGIAEIWRLLRLSLLKAR
jgi:SepF-like predicted cell division protein (DUF552 family)